MEAITIRRAVFTDVLQIEALGRRGLEESSQLYPAYHMGHVMKGLIDAIDKGLVWLATEKLPDGRERAVGGIVVGMSFWPQNPQVVTLTNDHLYVLPEYRARATAEGIPVGNALLDILKGLADEAQMPAFLNLTFGDSVEARAKLAERSGYRLTGTNHIYEPQAKAVAEAAE